MYQRSKRHPELFLPGSGGVWWCFLPNPAGGRRLRQSTGHTDERAAYAEFLARARGPLAAEQTAPQKSLVDALAERIEWLKAARLNDDPTRKKPSESTIDFYRKKGKPLVRILGAATPLAAITHERIRKYIAARTREGKRGTTIAKELTTLSKAMDLARKDGYECPAFELPEGFSSRYVPKTRWLGEDEVDALLEILPPKRAAVVAFIVATSATYPSEVAPVRPAHVKGNVVHLPGTKREARDRTLRVPPYARRYLRMALQHLGPSGFEPWTSIRRDLHDAARLLSMCPACRNARLAWARHEEGVTKRRQKTKCTDCARTPRFVPLCPTDLRRTFAQWLVRSGVPYELAYPLMGHSSPKMLESVYGRRDAAAAGDLIELALRKAPRGARRAG